MAIQVYVWRDHRDDPTSYWVTGRDAGAILGISATRVSQLAATGELPFVWHASRVRMFRRHQFELHIAGGNGPKGDDAWCWFMTSDRQASTLRDELTERGYRGIQASQGKLVSLVLVPEDEERLEEIRALLANHQEVLKGPVRLSTI